MAATTLNPGEEAQLQQTIEMFEVIVQSQPMDTQSLEILKEAYSKLNREDELVNTSKRIAQAYLQQGQLSSAILEYETVLQRRPDDKDVRAALSFVERGEAEAGIVYSTDVRVAPGVTIAHVFDSSLHDMIVYVLVLLKNDRAQPAASEFYDFLQSPKADETYARFGFKRLR